MENYLKFLQFSVRCFYSDYEIIIIDYIASQLIASNYPLEENAMLIALKFNRNKINESLAILEKGYVLVKEDIDVLEQVPNKEKKLVKKYFWKINPNVKSDLEPLINKLKKAIKQKQIKDKQLQMQCQKCSKLFLPEEFIHDAINSDQIGKIHGKKVYRCIVFGCMGNLEEYTKSTEEIEENKQQEKYCEMIFQQIDEYLKALDNGDWKQQEKLLEEKKNIMVQQQIEMAKNNQEYVGLTNQKLYNVYYSLQRRIIKKVYKKRLNLRHLFAINKSDMHLSASQKLKEVSLFHECKKKELIEDKIRLLKNMFENRNMYQAWSNEDYSKLFSEQRNKKMI